MQLQNTFASEDLDIADVDLMDIAVAEASLDDETKVEAYTAKLQSLDDEEFDRTIVSLIKNTNDISELINRLAEYDVELNINEDGADVETMALRPGDVNVECYAARRAGQSYYHLISNVTFDEPEAFTGSIDALVIYFDKDKLAYYDAVAVTDGPITVASTRTYKDGYITFNLDDSYITGLDYVDDYTAAVYVTPKVYGKEADYGTVYCHTYTTVDISVTGKISITPAGPLGEFVFSVNPKEESFEVSDSNAVIPIK